MSLRFESALHGQGRRRARGTSKPRARLTPSAALDSRHKHRRVEPPEFLTSVLGSVSKSSWLYNRLRAPLKLYTRLRARLNCSPPSPLRSNHKYYINSSNNSYSINSSNNNYYILDRRAASRRRTASRPGGDFRTININITMNNNMFHTYHHKQHILHIIIIMMIVHLRTGVQGCGVWGCGVWT